MNANKLRLSVLSIMIVLAIIIVVIVMSLSRGSKPSHATVRQTTRTAVVSTKPNTASHASESQSTSTVPIPSQVLKEQWPPSVTPTIKKDIITTTMPTQVKSQLYSFLKAYYTLSPSDVRSRRTAHIESLVSKRALPLDLSLDGVPKDTVSTLNKIEENKLIAQLDPSNPNQILITVPVEETMRSQGSIAYQTLQTGMWFEYSPNSGWSIIHFAEAVAP